MAESGAARILDEAADDVRRLDDYATTAELSQAIRSVAATLERALRTRLRNDPGSPDSHRLSALDPGTLSLDEVVKTLRARDLISLETAGSVHEVTGAAERAESGSARAGDADVVRAAVDRLRSDLSARTPAAAVAAPAPAPGAKSADAAEPAAAADRSADESVVGRGGRWVRWLAAAFAALAVIAAAWVFTRDSSREHDAALMAFRAGRLDSAAAGFERVLEDQPEQITSMLYLARTYRRLDRPSDAAEVLRRAVDIDPEDADVRRELGHLFMDLDRVPSAIAQYERALEHDPDQPLNWAALIQALRAAGDGRAETLLQEAPPNIQAALTEARP